MGSCIDLRRILELYALYELLIVLFYIKQTIASSKFGIEDIFPTPKTPPQLNIQTVCPFNFQQSISFLSEYQE